MAKFKKSKPPNVLAPPDALPLMSKEVLQDISREAAQVKEGSKAVIAENYKFFWCCNLSLREVATNFGIFSLFVDLFAILTAARHIQYLGYQFLFCSTVFGPPLLIFAVNSVVFREWAFVLVYLTCLFRFLINGVLMYFHFQNSIAIKEMAKLASQANQTSKVPQVSSNSTLPSRPPTMFKSPIACYVMMGICALMALLQIWAAVVVVFRSRQWIRHRQLLQGIQEKGGPKENKQN
uniref:Uncharacterized protein n=1 Tax=Panagrolaimus sp. JU765 TaxID=591449 RepID=A0AC34QXE6_9BILA